MVAMDEGIHVQGLVSDTDEEDPESMPVSQAKINERSKRNAAVWREVRHNLDALTYGVPNADEMMCRGLVLKRLKASKFVAVVR